MIFGPKKQVFKRLAEKTAIIRKEEGKKIMNAIFSFFMAGDMIAHLEKKVPTLNDFQWEIYLSEAEKTAKEKGFLESCGKFFENFRGKESARRKRNVDGFLAMIG